MGRAMLRSGAGQQMGSFASSRENGNPAIPDADFAGMPPGATRPEMKPMSPHASPLRTATALCAALPGFLHAAAITWSTPSNIAGDADVSLNGTLQYAYNLTNTNRTVNGVVFTGKNSPTTLDDKVTQTFSSNTTAAYSSATNPFNGLSAAYKSLLVGGNYRDAASSTAVTTTLKNLTPGKSYAVQVWVSDPRGTPRTQVVTGGGGNTVTLDFNVSNGAGGLGQHTTGTFTADATTQTFTLTATNTQLNALQVREISLTNNLWSGEVNGNWDDATLNFSGQSFTTVAAASNSVVFRDTNFSGAAVTNTNVAIQASGVAVASVSFANTTALPYTFSNASGSTGITGATALFKTGNGTVTLSGANTYTGSLALSSGVLIANHADALGTGNINFLGGTLRYGSGISTDWSGKIAGSTSPINIDTNGNTVSFVTGIAAGNTGGLVKSGAGTLELAGVSSYTGNTTVSAGTLTFTGPDIANNSRVEIASTATLHLDHVDADSVDSLTFDGVLQAPGIWGAVGNASATHHDARITGDGLLVVNPLDVWWDGSGTTWGAPAAWSASASAATPDLAVVPDATNIVHFSGSGVSTDQVVDLDADQAARGLAFSGTPATFLQAGGTDRSLSLGASGITIAAATGAVTIGSASDGEKVGLLLTGNQTWNNASANAMTVQNPIDLGFSTLTLSGRAPLLSGAISGSGALVNNSTGILELPDGNSYTGGTTTAAGTLHVYADDSAANGGWSVGPASANTTTVNFEVNSVIAVAAGKTVRIGNNVAGGTANQTLNVAGSVNNAGTLYVGRPAILNINDGGHWTQSGTMSLNGHGGYTAFMNVNAGGSFTYTGASAIALNPAPENAANGILTINGGTLTTGMPFVFGASSGSVGGIPGKGRVLLANGGTLKLSAELPALTTGDASGIIAVGGGDGGIIDTNGFDAATDEVIGNKPDINNTVFETGTLVKAGAGTLSLSSANTYTGNTKVTGGTLSLAHAYLADTSTVEIAAGAVLNLSHGAADTVAALVLGGVTQGAGSYSAATHPAFISGTGSLVVPASDPFVAWIDGFTSLTAPADKTKAADPDHDGLSNLLEFALNGDPTSGSASGKLVSKVANVSGDNYLTLTLPVRSGASFSGSGPLTASKDGLKYEVEGDANLGGFTGGVAEVTPALSAGLPALSSGWEYRSFRLSTTVSAAPKGFLRAEVTELP